MITEFTQHYTPCLPDDPAAFKQHFIEHDALENITSELVFSITKRYTCKAGCKMCYVKDEWATDEEMQLMVPHEIPTNVEQQILKFFDSFNTITTMDDLVWLKRKHPHLYAFYVRNSHRMLSTAMTDNAFLQQFDIIMNEMSFISIYEISFSDIFLEKQQGGLVDTIVEKLEAMHAMFPILKIKLIFCNEQGENQPGVSKVIEWAHSHDIHVCIHADILQGKNTIWELNQADYQGLTYYSEDGRVYQVLGEVTHLQYTSVFHTISQAIAVNSVPFFDIMSDGIDISLFIYKSLRSKLDLYAEYANSIQDTDSKFSMYFKYCASNIVTNPDFNWIPILVLKPWTKLYKSLYRQGWNDTDYGLCLPAVSDQVIPLFKIRKSNDTQV